MKKVFLVVIITSALFSLRTSHPAPALAILPDGGGGCSSFFDCLLSGISIPNLRYGSSTGLVGRVISDFLPAILGIAGFITVIVVVISGIQFILSSGNPEAAAAARGRLTYALVGFIIIVLAFAILQIVNRIFLGPTGVA